MKHGIQNFNSEALLASQVELFGAPERVFFLFEEVRHARVRLQLTLGVCPSVRTSACLPAFACACAYVSVREEGLGLKFKSDGASLRSSFPPVLSFLTLLDGRGKRGAEGRGESRRLVSTC